METIKSALWRLSMNDVVKGLKVVIFTTLAAALLQAFQGHGFDVASYDWHGILKTAVEAGAGYLLHKFSSDQEGKTFGKI